MITLNFGKDGRGSLLKGMEKMYKAIAASMGPSGRNFFFEERDNTYLSKDGATIARFIHGAGLIDKFERAGAALLRRASQKTEEEAGDGTTQATVLAHAMAVRGKEFVDEGANVIAIEKGMRKAYDEVVKTLETMKHDAKDRQSWEDVAYISSRDKKIAEMIGEAMEKVGPEGFIRVDTGDDWTDHEMKLEVKEGMTFSRGYTHDIAINDFKKLTCTLKNTRILVTDLQLMTENDAKELVRISNAVYASGHKDIVIIAKKFAGIVIDFIMQTNAKFIATKGQESMKVLTVEAPGYGSSFTDEFCDDIAVITGAKFIGEKQGGKLKYVTIDDLGECELVEAGKKETHIIGKNDNQVAISTRLAQIEAQYENATGELEKRRMEERKAALTSGVAIITVGGRNTENIGEKKARVDDAKLATRCAYDEGIVPGGGISYVKAADALQFDGDEDEKIGMEIVKDALLAPLMTIAKNCCLDPDVIVMRAQSLETDETLNMNRGNAETVNAFDAGVVDPVKVLKSALLNAIETALIFLTTETVGVSIPEDKNGRPLFELIRGDAAASIAPQRDGILSRLIHRKRA
jgi:chaperonin GroEL